MHPCFTAHPELLGCCITSGPCAPLCFGIEAVERKSDAFFGHSPLYHCYCLHDTLRSLLVQELYMSVSCCSQQIIASAQDLRSPIDFSRITTLEKSYSMWKMTSWSRTKKFCRAYYQRALRCQKPHKSVFLLYSPNHTKQSSKCPMVCNTVSYLTSAHFRHL